MKANARKVLIVDDEQDIRQLLKTFLEENRFTVTLAEDGIKAMECIRQDIPGIAIVDLLLPGEHGINLVKSIKSEYFIPTIMISGVYSQEEVAPVMDEYFVDGFLPKPIDLQQLLKLIETIIDDRK